MKRQSIYNIDFDFSDSDDENTCIYFRLKNEDCLSLILIKLDVVSISFIIIDLLLML